MNKKTTDIAIGGICLAISVLAVFLATVTPGFELTLYAVSSIFVAIMILEAGVKGGFLLYGGTILLCLILVPNKIALVPYVFFFGLYGIIKYYAEKTSKPALQIFIKGLVFAGVFLGGYFLFRELFFGNIRLPDFPWPILAAAGILFLFVYDFIFTLLIQLYRQRIRRTEKNIKVGGDR